MRLRETQVFRSRRRGDGEGIGSYCIVVVVVVVVVREGQEQQLLGLVGPRFERCSATSPVRR